MPHRLIQRLADGSLLEFGQGKFDDWCVFLTRPGMPAYAPSDREYFADLRHLALRQGNHKVYGDFVQVFDRTGSDLSESVLQLIGSLLQRIIGATPWWRSGCCASCMRGCWRRKTKPTPSWANASSGSAFTRS